MTAIIVIIVSDKLEDANNNLIPYVVAKSNTEAMIPTKANLTISQNIFLSEILSYANSFVIM